ncbi:hypothetical protein KDRO_B04830 [Kluyveromyces lactis]|nr:hypothetical protein KDRO_B04830 [Kluyveromyces lactis]
MSGLPLSLQMEPVVHTTSTPVSVRERERGQPQTNVKNLPRKHKSKSITALTSSNSPDSKQPSLKWNVLPKIGETLHQRKHSMNVTYTDSMHIAYDPRYNSKLNKFDTFIQFNEQCELSDVITMAPARLESFVKFLNYYYESKKFMTNTEERAFETSHYPGTIDGINFLEVDYLVQLWYLQCLRFLHKTRSLSFSPSIVKSLLQRRQRAKHRSVSNGFVDPDILVIRSNTSDSFWGWQVAYDEPSLNIVDYEFEVSIFSKGRQDILALPMCATLSNLAVRDVMGRSTDDLEDGISPIDSLEQQERSDSDVSSTTADSAGKNSINSRNSSTASNKLMKAAHAGTSGLAHLFKKKSSTALSTASPTLDAITTADTMNPTPAISDSGTLTLKNKWLENYYSKKLSNYSSVHSPCCYETPISTPLEKGFDEKKMLEYKLQYLKIKLPFQDNSIPSMLCPNLWFHLRFDKWKSVLQEIYRCLVPGGSIQTEDSDFKGSSIDADDECSNATTSEFRKILDAAALEAMKENIQIFPMRHLVHMLNEVGFVNVKCCILSLKRGDLVNNLGFMYEFMAMCHYDSIVKRYLSDPSLYPEDTYPPTFPMRYFNERINSVDNHVGALRMVCITAEKPLR